ncbi:MAG TPA: hypothetical protein VH437_00270 [Terriglobales bacterium]|jgi:hypothetical protein
MNRGCEFAIKVAAIALTVFMLEVWTPAQTAASPEELVRRTVQNELKTDSTKFMFRERKENEHGSQTKLMVQTKDAMAGMLIEVDDKQIGPDQRLQEETRLRHIASDPETLHRKQKQEKEDSGRAAQIMRALPDAFLYERDGSEVGTQGVGKQGDELVRLKFKPNPKYNPPSRTEQVLTGMQGYMLIDEKAQRLAKIDGTLFKDVAFGWGILGHLDKGGRFIVRQGEIAPGHWDVTTMDLDFTGKILLFKSLKIKSKETYSDFLPVPPDLTFAQGIDLLKKQMLNPTSAETQAGISK